jgi:hypothetical protein
MSKMADLQAQLSKTNGPKKAGKGVEAAPASEASGGSLPQESYKAPSREGKIHIGVHLPSDFKRSLRLVQAQTGEAMQTIVARALNELFRAHNVPVVGD